MSHFIICSSSLFIFGTPKGQASTQFEQAIHRGLSEDWTTPSSVCLIASAGQTSAHVGRSQCMHTVGTVAIVLSRSMKSMWIIGYPRCVSHSAHAFTHASHPMQREGSMKNPYSTRTSVSCMPTL